MLQATYNLYFAIDVPPTVTSGSLVIDTCLTVDIDVSCANRVQLSVVTLQCSEQNTYETMLAVGTGCPGVGTFDCEFTTIPFMSLVWRTAVDEKRAVRIHHF